jgi:hypothetical protein
VNWKNISGKKKLFCVSCDITTWRRRDVSNLPAKKTSRKIEIQNEQKTKLWIVMENKVQEKKRKNGRSLLLFV